MKLYIRQLVYIFRESLPARGAWVEIGIADLQEITKLVAPREGGVG